MANETVELTIQFVNPPKEGSKWGSIKSSEGIFYGGPPALLRQFTAGEVCTIEFSKSANGLYNNIVKKIGASKPAPLSPPPRQRTHPNDQTSIFVTALLGHFIHTGKVALQEDMIAEAADMILRAYRKCSLGGLQVQTRDDMDDSIGF
jgi:hypothetical protein